MRSVPETVCETFLFLSCYFEKRVKAVSVLPVFQGRTRSRGYGAPTPSKARNLLSIVKQFCLTPLLQMLIH